MTDTLSELAGKDLIDSRDLYERLCELESEREAHEEEETEAKDELDALDTDDELDVYEAAQKRHLAAAEALLLWDQENGEFKALQELSDEIGSEFMHGESLILDDHWSDYVQELCEDIGDLPKDLPSYIVIDWDATGENLKVDYSECEIDGHTYYYRMS